MLRVLTRSVPRNAATLTRSFASTAPAAGRVAKNKEATQTSVLATLSKAQNLFKTYKPVSPGLRHLKRPLSPHLYQGPPVRALTVAKRKTGGRNNHGHVTVRHRGGGHRQRIRILDFHRAEPGKQDVVRIEFDPGRSAHIALLKHRNPNAKELWTYIIAPDGIRAGDVVESFREGIPDGLVAGFTDPYWKGRNPEPSTPTPASNPTTPPTSDTTSAPVESTSPSNPINPFDAEPVAQAPTQAFEFESDDDARQLSIGLLRALIIRSGNVLPLRIIPPGTMIHAITLDPNGRAILVRSAGSFATVVSQDAESEKDGKYTQVKLQSGEVRHILSSCCATIGKVSNANWKDRSLGKAGRSRNLGWRPSVRGVAMNTHDHPHGGGRGKSKGNKHPRSIYGLKKGVRTRRPGPKGNKLVVKQRPRGKEKRAK
ncbi:mitochondrial ribosomal protein subunit L2 [Clavulina sp. PMI_390]|nr:mitochondrial ribosomal protein subunit L2 [Clavulina sp. PMI_390]